MRKIIQIACGENPKEVVALCDDGSLWFRDYQMQPNTYHAHVWEQIPEIPQDEILEKS